MKNVRQACSFVVSALEDIGADIDVQFQCELSIDEIFTNIVEHGYQHQGAEKMIEIAVDVNTDQFKITIVDEAEMFNPLDTNDGSRQGVGGWGISFVRRVMDEINYYYEDFHNHLVLIKRLS